MPLGIPVIFVDPRGTSKTCRKCDHHSRSNRPSQALFRCVACQHQDNADANASYNIAVSGARLWAQGPSDLARPLGQTDPSGGWPDKVQARLPLAV
jgi:transposase